MTDPALAQPRAAGTAPPVSLLYFAGCPNWHEAERRLHLAMRSVGIPAQALTLHRVETPEEADRISFRGSPTVLVNGTDPFADPSAPVGLACRIYRTSAGTEGGPSVAELTEALRAG